MKIVSLTFDSGNKTFTYMKGGKTKNLNINEALGMIQPEQHTFKSKREGLVYTIQSLTNGQLTNYLRIIEKYTNCNLIGQEYMDFKKHLPTIDDKYNDCYEMHYLSLIFEKIKRRNERNK
jgi:hypothetical protein